MAGLVLESEIGSQYDDSPHSYEFPTRYLRFFEPLSRGETMVAVLYEPRGDESRGRMAYVALAELVGSPQPTGRRNKAGSQLWRVQYARPAEPFEKPVPREWLGTPVETWLTEIPRGRERNVATFGRAVRPVTDEDLATILQLAAAPDLVPATRYPTADEHAEPLIAVRERASVLVAAFQRDASFRHQVLGAYEHRCAVSGLGLGAISTTKTRGILDAAHIRPVQSGGPDAVSNGLPLTPTLHRLFDAGLFTLRYEDDHPVVRVSQNLDREVIEVPERGFSLPLRDGLRLLTPKGREQFPNRHQLEFHERHVFLG